MLHLLSENSLTSFLIFGNSKSTSLLFFFFMLFYRCKRVAMGIDSSWDFKTLVDNLKTLREEYNIWIAFFSSCPYSTKLLNSYIKYVRDKFYSLNIKEWQIDMCWEYMNGDRFLRDIRRILIRIDK